MADSTPLLYDVDANEGDASGIFTPNQPSTPSPSSSLFTQSTDYEGVDTPVSDVKLKSTQKNPDGKHNKEAISFDDGGFALVLAGDDDESDKNESAHLKSHELRKCCVMYINMMDHLAVRIIVMLFWFTLVIIGGGWGIGGFLKSTTFAFHPIQGTPSDAASAAFLHSFPDGESITVATAVVQLVDTDAGSTLLSPPGPLRNFTYALRDAVNSYESSDVVKGFVGYWTIVDGVESIGSAKVVLSSLGAGMASDFLDEDKTTSYVALALQNVPPDSSFDQISQANAKVTAFTTFVLDKLRNSDIVPEELNVWLTGRPLFTSDILTGVESNMSSVELVAFPLAMAVLATMLRSVRLLLIPFCCIVSSVTTTMLILWPVARVYPMVTFCPSVIMSVVLALSIDYSLFLLSRFREENFIHGQGRRISVENMLVFAGHTVLVSGCTICLCFLALVVFPAKMLASIGMGSGVAIVVTIMVNMTLTPAILLTFFGFFTHFQCLGLACCCCRNATIKCLEPPLKEEEEDEGPRSPSMASSSHVSNMLENAAAKKQLRGDDPEERVEADLADLELQAEQLVEFAAGTPSREEEAEEAFSANRGCWTSVGVCTQQLKVPLTVVMLLSVIPFVYFSFQMQFVHTFELVAPRHSDSIKGYEQLVDNFGASKLFPSTLLIVPTDNTRTTSPEFFERAQGYVESLSAYLVNKTHQHSFEKTTFSGLVWNCALMDALRDHDIRIDGDNGGCAVPYNLYDLALNGPDETNSTKRAAQEELINLAAFIFGIGNGTHVLQEFTENIKKAYVNTTDQAMQLTVGVPHSVDLFGIEGGHWIDTMRQAIKHVRDGAPDDIYLCKGDTLTHDAIDIVNAYFPFVMIGTLVLVFILVAISFRSIMVPVRSVLTITMTLAWVYGLAVLTYQYGIFNWTGLPFLQESGGMYWFAPVMSFSVIVGVGLDYDIFLLTRVLEYRRKALTEAGAVVKGLVMSGHIITAAGVIMAIAFSGLLMSSETVMNQLAFLLVMAVLVDTFIVRSILVPAIMGILGRANWWPQRLVEPQCDPYDKGFLQSTHCCCCPKRKYTRHTN